MVHAILDVSVLVVSPCAQGRGAEVERMMETDRVQRVVDLIETILTEIAEESSAPYTTASAMSEFFMDITHRITQISTARFEALIRHAQQPDD